ncbi:MAG TPA: hypothetical protein DIU35_09545 [Candidatus Latescibacteria bacterium]|nr:hypothetical protein [Gemmatimonadota bacterium]HCR17716.1 hypothetical protein [Candidatus Latescibacterota bacterium]
MAKSKAPARRQDGSPQSGGQDDSAQPPTFRERLELILFLVVEILCLLLFIDFLFLKIYVK